MTDAERAELEAHLAQVSRGADLVALLAGAGFAGGATFVLLTVLSALVRWLVGGVLLSQTLLVIVSLAVAGAVAGAWGLQEARSHKGRLARRDALARDLAQGVVEEDLADVARLQRFQEPEHFTELLVLTCTDGRVRAILDDSTTDTEGDKPRRSDLKLGRHMQVLRFPLSGREVTRFSGGSLRRPPAIPSDPLTWPADETWIVPEDLTRIVRAQA